MRILGATALGGRQRAGAGRGRKEGRRLGEKEATPTAPTLLRMRHTSASSIFDASAAAQLSSRPEVGGAGLAFAVGRGCGAPLRPRPRLWKGGVCWAFLLALREGRRPVVRLWVARSDPREPRCGWRGKCGARRGAQSGVGVGGAGRAGREASGVDGAGHRNWSLLCFVRARRSPPPSHPRALLPGRHSSPPPSVSRNRIFGNVPERQGSFLPQAPMSNYVNDMWPGSPLQSPEASGGSSRLSSASRSRSSRGSRSRSSGSSRWSASSSGSRPRRRSRSRSRSRRRHQRKYRRYSRSYSRSRSRSCSRRRGHRERRYGSSRRHYRSPSPGRSRSRSRSRSRGRSYYRRAHAVTRGRRYYGFGRTVYPDEHGSWRGRSRSRSRSPTPFRLSEKGGCGAA